MVGSGPRVELPAMLSQHNSRKHGELRRSAACVVVFGALTASGGADGADRAPMDLREEDGLDSPRTAHCLERARTLLRARRSAFEVMFAALEHPPEAGGTCRAMDPSAPFAAFEGWWAGRWGDMEVAHLWLTVAPGVQLVALADGQTRRWGINLRHDGVLCGLVVSPNGRERLHHGRFQEADGHRPARLVWSTPNRVYQERVSCQRGRRVYEILEEIREEEGLRPGMTAQYQAAG